MISPSQRLRLFAFSARGASRRGVSVKAWSVLSFLIVLVVVCIAGNLFWLRHHFLTIPPPWDQALYLYMGVRYLWTFSDAGLVALIREFVRLSPDVAPLFPLTSLPLYLLFGPSQLAAYMTNAIYLLLLCGGVYLLGAHVYGRKTGLLAAFVLATFTATINYSRDYLLEFPATAFVTLALYAFVRSGELMHRPWTLVFGILAGLSVLTKTMTGVFFIGPVLFALGDAIRQRHQTSAVLLNALLAFAVGALVASIWWGPNFRTAFGYLIYYGFQDGSVPYSKGGAAVFTWENLRYYALALINHGTSFGYASLFVVLILARGIQHGLRRWRRDTGAFPGGRQEGTLWAWLLVGYALLTLVPNKGEERYAQPLLPPIALLMAGSIHAIGRYWMRWALIALVGSIGTFNYLGLTYGVPWIPRTIYVHPLAIVSHEYPHYSWVRAKLPAVPALSWPIEAILSLLARVYDRQRVEVEAALRRRDGVPGHKLESEAELRTIYHALLGREPRPREREAYLGPLHTGALSRATLIDTVKASGEFKGQRARVLVVPDHPQFNASTLRYYAEVARLPLRFEHILDGPILPERLRGFAFILVKDDGYQGPEFSTRYTDQIHALLQQGEADFFSRSESFGFPDGSQVIVYTARSTSNR